MAPWKVTQNPCVLHVGLDIGRTGLEIPQSLQFHCMTYLPGAHAASNHHLCSIPGCVKYHQLDKIAHWV